MSTINMKDYLSYYIIHQFNKKKVKKLKKMTAKLGQDVITFYKPYRNYDADWKTTVISKQKFEVYGRYEIIDVIGQGAYGIVVAAKDKLASDKTKQLVAIKKIDKAFQHKIFAKRTLRELRLLKLLKHQNIINIETIILPKSRQQFEDVYVVSEMMDTDLTSIIKSDQPLTQQHYKFFLYQLLRGLKYIHSAKIVHRDLKPRNLLVNSNCDLKICDFGLARPLFKNVKANVLTQYVATRWYRAPQLLLSANHYTTSVDMWSVGCIFAQMLQRKPFLPGTDTKNQIELICEYLGTPDLENMKHIPEQSKKLIKNLPKNKKNGKDFSKLFGFAPPQAIDLLKKFLIFDPEKRITVQQALKHPYMADLHLEQDQPTRQQVDLLDFQFEDCNLTTQQFKDLLYEQILLYHNKQFYQNYQEKKKRRQSLISHILTNSNKNYIDPYADSDD